MVEIALTATDAQASMHKAPEDFFGHNAEHSPAPSGVGVDIAQGFAARGDNTAKSIDEPVIESAIAKLRC